MKQHSGGDSFPQLLCDSYANPAPAGIPENYCRAPELSTGASVPHVSRTGDLPRLSWRLSLSRKDVYEIAAAASASFNQLFQLEKSGVGVTGIGPSAL